MSISSFNFGGSCNTPFVYNSSFDFGKQLEPSALVGRNRPKDSKLKAVIRDPDVPTGDLIGMSSITSEVADNPDKNDGADSSTVLGSYAK